MWSWILSGLGVTGLWLIGRKHWWAWGIAFTNECLWMVYAVVTKQYGFIFGALAYGCVHAKTEYNGAMILHRKKNLTLLLTH